MIKIDKNIPLPAGGGKHSGPKRKYPFHDMAVGDSFFVPGKRTTDLSPSVTQFRNKYAPESMFTTRAEPGGVRVWRIA